MGCGSTLRNWLDSRNNYGYSPSNNIFHRDLKPRNVFISTSTHSLSPSSNLHVQIGDFGLAKRDDLFGESTISAPNTPSEHHDGPIFQNKAMERSRGIEILRKEG